MASSDYNKETADEFLDRVDDITGRIDAILKGDASVTAEEERFWEEQKIKKQLEEIHERERAEKVAKGIKGKGIKGNFKTFCLGCHTEYHHEAVEFCNNCGRETTPNEVSFISFATLSRIFQNFLKFELLILIIILCIG